MKSEYNNKENLRNIYAVLAVVFFIGFVNQYALGYSPEMRRSLVEEPWGLIVRVGQDGSSLQFPITVSDANKPEKLEDVFPVMGTPFKIRLKQYVPDLKWENSVVEKENGGIVANLVFKGAGVEDGILLNSDNPQKNSITSSVGSVELKRIFDPDILEELMQGITNNNAIGTISIKTKDGNVPMEYVANLKEAITLPLSNYKIQILKYIPHYSIDTKTKTVTNISDSPVNPAIKIRINDGEQSYEKWIWSKYPGSPHDENQLDIHIEFNEIHPINKKGYYTIVSANASDSWVLWFDGEKFISEKLKLVKDYPFSNEAYTFNIEKLVDNAAIETYWKNNSDSLSYPALIGEISHGDEEHEFVLELNKPFHDKTSFGRLTLLYKKIMGEKLKNQGVKSARQG